MSGKKRWNFQVDYPSEKLPSQVPYNVELCIFRIPDWTGPHMDFERAVTESIRELKCQIVELENLKEPE